jgi:Methylase involved in ubiquinone/menaquinone biosynthesis
LAGFPESRISVDYDFDSLMAGSENASRWLRVQADAGRLPIRDESAAVCLSNSVLEHLPSLENCFAEVRRVLRPGGRFIFTMTLGVFSAQLLRMSGASDARRWLTAFGHHQEPDETTLTGLLQAAGFSVQQKITYQPESVTATYRLLLSPAFQFIERRCRSDRFNKLRERLARRVAASLETTPSGRGACIFIVAAKGDG